MLLAQAGFKFEVIAPDDSVEPQICSGQSPAELVSESSFLKARHVAVSVDSGIVLAADTVAECGGQILGKPVDRQHALRMLTLLSGREHRVITGVTLWSRPDDRFETRIEHTILKMNPLSPNLLESYLDSDQWIGKAGAFGYQDGLDWVHIIRGSESNVVGLPMEGLRLWLEAFSAVT